jgi:hypothetical protein
MLTSTNGGPVNSFTFPSDLPGDTTGKRMLIGTNGLCGPRHRDAGLRRSERLLLPHGRHDQLRQWLRHLESHPPHPSPPLSLNRDGTTGTNSPTNFAGATGTIPTAPPAIGFSPSPVTFSNTSMNTTGPVNMVTITNNHTSAVTISSVTVSGDFLTPGNNCTTLNPAATCSAGLYFKPTGEGTRNGTVIVTSDAPGSPHTAVLTGVGERSLVVHYYRSILAALSTDAGGARPSGRLRPRASPTWAPT